MTNTELELVEKFIADSIKGTRFEGATYLAGGAVRDKLLGIRIKDIDILVNIKDGGIDLAQFLGDIIGKTPVIYKNYGTAQLSFSGYEYQGTVFSKNAVVEFVHSRKEAYRGDSRNPDTEFGTLAEDAFRRDFTINSMYQDIITGKILDLTGYGRADLENSILRSTGDPNIIFTEDPLRILRAIRFSKKYTLSIEFLTNHAMSKYSSRIKIVSVERITDELRKIFSGFHANNALALMNRTGITEAIFNIAYPNAKCRVPHRNNWDMHMNNKTNLYINLFFFFKNLQQSHVPDGNQPLPLEENFMSNTILGMKNLRFSNSEIEQVTKLSLIDSEFVMNNIQFSNSEIEQVAKLSLMHSIFVKNGSLKEFFNVDEFKKIVITNSLFVIDKVGISETIIEFVSILYSGTIFSAFQEACKIYKPIPVNGNEIMNALNLNSGEQIGKLIHIGKHYYFTNHCKPSKDDIISHLKLCVL